MPSELTPVLAIFVNPRGTVPLRYGNEGRVIRESILLSRHRDRLSLTMRHASSVAELRHWLAEEPYQVVHVSGTAPHGLELEDGEGVRAPVPLAELGRYLHKHVPPLRCLLLSNCYPVEGTDFTALGVPHAVAMDVAVDDQAAVEFCHGFYDALGAGRAVPQAYQDACRTVERTAPSLALRSTVRQASW
jgi:hypothetical protein